MSWVFIKSWHRIAFTDRGGAVRTRCGRRLAVEGTLTLGPGRPIETHRTAASLPLGEPSCESCTRLLIHDQEQAPA